MSRTICLVYVFLRLLFTRFLLIMVRVMIMRVVHLERTCARPINDQRVTIICPRQRTFTRTMFLYRNVRITQPNNLIRNRHFVLRSYVSLTVREVSLTEVHDHPRTLMSTQIRTRLLPIFFIRVLRMFHVHNINERRRVTHMRLLRQYARRVMVIQLLLRFCPHLTVIRQ